ncbi:dihydrofolate reductase [Deminuibacter soli]|uniref:Dihydrofolate reductase n=1 Tax=Deminuibacter soli TaxID=2291815 RepID=A0A3E1NLS1_9BACT|nr:dihydrofolate reductase [Deminuibacter soli]RFM28794.1 dihydrofolate reductase [Deminuibacter soli]
MIVSLIVAAAEDNAIGKNNELLWRLPNDLRFFKNKTWAMPVAMGRKTYESFKGEPLSGRLNIIITRSGNEWPGAVTVHNLKDALFLAQQHDYKELLVAGGGEIYREAMSLAGRIYLTRVHASFPEADTFFPALDERQWQLTANEDFAADEKHAYAYSFQTWERR